MSVKPRFEHLAYLLVKAAIHERARAAERPFEGHAKGVADALKKV